MDILAALPTAVAAPSPSTTILTRSFVGYWWQVEKFVSLRKVVSSTRAMKRRSVDSRALGLNIQKQWRLRLL